MRLIGSIFQNKKLCLYPDNNLSRTIQQVFGKAKTSNISITSKVDSINENDNIVLCTELYKYRPFINKYDKSLNMGFEKNIKEINDLRSHCSNKNSENTITVIDDMEMFHLNNYSEADMFRFISKDNYFVKTKQYKNSVMSLNGLNVKSTIPVIGIISSNIVNGLNSTLMLSKELEKNGHKVQIISNHPSIKMNNPNNIFVYPQYLTFLGTAMINYYCITAAKKYDICLLLLNTTSPYGNNSFYSNMFNLINLQVLYGANSDAFIPVFTDDIEINQKMMALITNYCRQSVICGIAENKYIDLIKQRHDMPLFSLDSTQNESFSEVYDCLLSKIKK